MTLGAGGDAAGPLSLNNQYVTTTYSPYDYANHLLGMVIQGPSTQIENLLYQYDPNGNEPHSPGMQLSHQGIGDGYLLQRGQ